MAMRNANNRGVRQIPYQPDGQTVAATAPQAPVNAHVWVDTTGSGGVSRPSLVYTTKTADYTVTTSDVVIFANGTLTLTMPTAVGNGGLVYYIKQIAEGKTVTIDANGLEEIDEQLCVELDYPSAVTLVSDNANWWII